MSPFGFTPDDGDEENGKPEDLNAMMRQMQEQIQKQFEQLGINQSSVIRQRNLCKLKDLNLLELKMSLS